MNKKTLGIVLIIALILLISGIFKGNYSDDYVEEYSYQEYEKASRDKYLSFKENILTELKSRLNLAEKTEWQNDYNNFLGTTSSQFEGPQVHLEKLIYNGKEYFRDSVIKHKNKYPEFVGGFNIHELIFDPDSKTRGKPDLNIKVTDPRAYNPIENKNLLSIVNSLGFESEGKPYKTYTKEVFSIIDSTIKIERIRMDLWLTKFNITLETKAWQGRRDGEDDGRREIANQRHYPFEVDLKIYPNVSPWYVNTGNSFDIKPDIAVGAIYVNKITKFPEDDDKIGVSPSEPGIQLPLVKQDYYNNLNTPEKLIEDKAGDATVWNKPIYAKVYCSNIGTYRNLFRKGDEKISFELVMPLLVRGNWDIRIPNSIIPEYKPLPPYRRTLADVLIPSWGIGFFGKIASSLLYIVILVVIGLVFLKKLI
ncbi:hypothetical protein [Tenacibaculum xiamenense]|uniref:hypothetical protein n=1 Tax=Tenacibaculum xiamenense TaxID=1261553 RepID=UPI00389367E7